MTSSPVKETQQLAISTPPGTPEGHKSSSGRRSFEDCLGIFNDGGVTLLSNEEVILLAQHGEIAAYALEKVLGDYERAVVIRRALICEFSYLFHSFLKLISTFSASICNEDARDL
jgi:hypothetical protein